MRQGKNTIERKERKVGERLEKNPSKTTMEQLERREENEGESENDGNDCR